MFLPTYEKCSFCLSLRLWCALISYKNMFIDFCKCIHAILTFSQEKKKNHTTFCIFSLGKLIKHAAFSLTFTIMHHLVLVFNVKCRHIQYIWLLLKSYFILVTQISKTSTLYKLIEKTLCLLLLTGNTKRHLRLHLIYGVGGKKVIHKCGLNEQHV